MIKVALVNTSDIIGGAAIACYRLFEALKVCDGVEANLLVKEKFSEQTDIQLINNSFFKKKKGDLNFILEKLSFLPYERGKDIRFYYSNPNFGQDISQLPAIQDADIIHFHWINKGFLSFDSFQKIKALGKPIVWTMHDMWTFTGGCHYASACTNYENSCGNCNFLKSPATTDLSNQIWSKKKAFYQDLNIQFVTCSKWLSDVASSSGLLKSQKVTNIPNPINTDIFKPSIPSKSKTNTILFQAMNLSEERKGFQYLLKALESLKKTNPDFAKSIQLVIFGKAKGDLLENIGFKIEYLGLLKGEEAIIEAYNKSDCFIIPSLEDNLPNTVMESLACGKPVVAFNTGGIPEMVDHKKNGYIAQQKNVEDLANGIQWVLEDENRYNELSENAREKVMSHYSFEVVGSKYEEIYKSMIED